MKKLALLIGLLFASIRTSVVIAESSTSISKTTQSVDKSEDTISDNWIYLSIIAILLVLLVLIMLTFWTKRRSQKRV